MDAARGWTNADEACKVQASREELIGRLARALHGLRLRRASAPSELGYGVSFPSFCVIAQRSKEVLLGEKRYWYDSAHYLIATTALPIATRISEASEERPYLSGILTLDRALVGSVMVEAGHIAPQSDRRDSDRRQPAGRWTA